MVSSATQHRAQPDATTGRPRVLVDCSSRAATVAADERAPCHAVYPQTGNPFTSIIKYINASIHILSGLIARNQIKLAKYLFTLRLRCCSPTLNHQHQCRAGSPADPFWTH